MTVIKVKRVSGHIVSVEALGHTGFAANGEDIVCAALSSIIQTAALGLMGVAGLKLSLDRRDDDGYIRFTLNDELSERERRDADMILETMLCGVSDLYESYSDYINLEVI